MSRVVFRSTGTKEIAAAKRIAAQIIESFWNDAGSGAETLKLRNDTATIGELIERYRQNAEQRPGTVRGNARSLRIIVRTMYGEDPGQKPTSVLRADLIRQFEKRQIEAAEERATPTTRAALIQQTRNSTASFVRQARSIVTLRKMKFFKDLKLPELRAFRGESVEMPHTGRCPVLSTMKALCAMEAAVPKLAEKDPAVYVAHLLFSRLGLRNIEIANSPRTLNQ